MVTVLHNYDDIAQQPRGYGVGISSGRFFLSMLGDFFEFWGGNYNLPVVNGLLFLIFLAISAGFLVCTLRIRSVPSAALVGALFVVFPSATATLFFRYTSAYYGLAILLSVIAAWILERHRWGLLLSALCTALSLGIYQAYTPITISIFVLLLIQEALQGKGSSWALIKRGLYYAAALLLGVALYFLLLKLSLILYAAELSDYQGVGDMGKLSLSTLPGLIKEALYSVCMLPIKNYCGLNNMKAIKLVYALLGLISVFLTGYILLTRVRRLDIAILTCLLYAAFCVAVNFIVIMCPDTWIYTLMVYSFVLIACVPFVLSECLPSSKVRQWFTKLVVWATALLIFCYAYDGNISYSALYFANRQTENYWTSIVAQVRMTEGFDAEKKWAMIGQLDDPLMNCFWKYETRYGGSEFSEELLNRYSSGNWLQNYVGYLPETLDEGQLQALSETEQVRQMPCWPTQGSIQVIGDTVVIKFGELEDPHEGA